MYKLAIISVNKKVLSMARVVVTDYTFDSLEPEREIIEGGHELVGQSVRLAGVNRPCSDATS